MILRPIALRQAWQGNGLESVKPRLWGGCYTREEDRQNGVGGCRISLRPSTTLRSARGEERGLMALRKKPHPELVEGRTANIQRHAIARHKREESDGGGHPFAPARRAGGAELRRHRARPPRPRRGALPPARLRPQLHRHLYPHRALSLAAPLHPRQ